MKIQRSHVLVAFLTLLFSVSTYVFNLDSLLYRASVLSYPEHKAFDGTVYPLKKVPDWVKLSSSEYKMKYSEIPASKMTSLPYYDPKKLKTSTDDLVWGNSSDDKVRNAKITYSVPYMGNYLLDGEEYGGSHLAVDIKVPEKTPVYAIANGTVIKASEIGSGFGHHIVIMHNNVPDPDKPSKKTTLYSSYSHLSDVGVSVGDVVEKGEKIALSGSTGTATTPHLHFQIDNDKAPWHPFWHFTSAEASAAGLDFFSAINEAFHQDLAKEMTTNPMLYVQKYMDGDFDDFDEEEDVEDEDSNEDAESYVDEDEKEEDEEEDEEEEEDALEPELKFVIDVEDKYYVGKKAEFEVRLEDQFGNEWDDGFAGTVKVVPENGNVRADKIFLSMRHFDSHGVMENYFDRIEEGTDRMIIEYNGEEFYSDQFEVIDPDNVVFTDVTKSNQYFEAIKYLADKGIVNGYGDGSFKPENTVSRAEALKLIFNGIDADIEAGDLPFPDVGRKEWFSDYIHTAYARSIVQGYPDGTFKPNETVNRVEFLKMLFIAMDVDVNPKVASAPFDDVAVDAWYSPYVAYAKELKIVDSKSSKYRPDVGMSRGEVADVIYKLMKTL